MRQAALGEPGGEALMQYRWESKAWNLDMVVIFATHLIESVSTLRQIQMWLGSQEVFELNQEGCDDLSGRLDTLDSHIAELGFVITKSRIRHFKEALRPGCDKAVLETELRVLSEAIDDDLSQHTFMCVQGPDKAMFDQYEEPFGWEPSVMFDNELDFDISEAARCLALDRPTAAVFHLMRVMEMALQRLAKDLRVALLRKTRKGQSTKEKAWAEVLRDLRAKVNPRSERTEKQRTWKEQHTALLNYLDGVRLAWRNQTMHPKSSYEIHEAREIYSNVRTFLRYYSNMKLDAWEA